VLGVRTMQVNALLGDLGPAKRPQITAPFLHLYENRFALSARVSAERAMPKTGSLTGACSLLLKMENDVQRHAK